MKLKRSLYTDLLLGYAFVTPELRIVDLLPDTTNVYDRPQRGLTAKLLALRKFEHLRPPCLRSLDLENLSAAAGGMQDRTERFGHFVQLVHKTLSSGRLASMTRTTTLAITEGNVSVESGDVIWILFGCTAPMVFRHTASGFRVILPAFISDIMDGEVMDEVVTPNDMCGGWARTPREGFLHPSPALPYISGKRQRWVQVIRLR